MEVPQVLFKLFALIGLFYTAYLINFLTKTALHYLKHKEIPTSIDEEKIALHKAEIARLSTKIERLEQENDEITRTVLKRL